MISVVFCSRDPRKTARTQAMYEALTAGQPRQIIHIPDATGLAEAYNRALDRARGEVIVFSHDDIHIFAQDFYPRLMGHLQCCDVLGIAGTNRLQEGNWISSGPPYIYGQLIHPIPQTGQFQPTMYGVPSRRVDGMQALDGALFCCKREAATAIRFDAQTFPGFHLYDLDFTFRAFLAGYRISVANDLEVMHASSGNFDATWEQASQRFNEKHRGALAPLQQRKLFYSGVIVPTIQEALARLRPLHWT